MNLWTETNEVLHDNGHNWSEVLWVGSNTDMIPLDHFRKISDVHYDSGFGASEIPLDLKVVGPDWWLERHEYDGAEWWEFKEYPVAPSREVRPSTIILRGGYGWETLRELDQRLKDEEGIEW